MILQVCCFRVHISLVSFRFLCECAEFALVSVLLTLLVHKYIKATVKLPDNQSTSPHRDVDAGSEDFWMLFL